MGPFFKINMIYYYNEYNYNISFVLEILFQSQSAPYEMIPKDSYRMAFSKKGNPVILYKGYSYGINKVGSKTGEFGKYWRCTLAQSKKCKGTAIRKPDGSLWLRENHSHVPSFK